MHPLSRGGSGWRRLARFWQSGRPEDHPKVAAPGSQSPQRCSRCRRVRRHVVSLERDNNKRRASEPESSSQRKVNFWSVWDASGKTNASPHSRMKSAKRLIGCARRQVGVFVTSFVVFLFTIACALVVSRTARRIYAAENNASFVSWSAARSVTQAAIGASRRADVDFADTQTDLLSGHQQPEIPQQPPLNWTHALEAQLPIGSTPPTLEAQHPIGSTPPTATVVPLGPLPNFHVRTNPEAPLILLRGHSNARCMDGSPGGFHFRAAAKYADATKWVIVLPAGGSCDTQRTCQWHKGKSLSSSAHFLPRISSMEGPASQACSSNPLFCGFNHVQVGYCSQDFFVGRAAASKESFGLWFSGWHILQATLDVLERDKHLGYATEIIIFGSSAGAIGSWMLIDQVAARFPRARVVGLSMAGFCPTPYMFDGRPPPRNPWQSKYALHQSVVNDACLAAFPSEPWKCMMGEFGHRFVASDMFVVQPLADRFVFGHHGVPMDWRAKKSPAPAAVMAYMTRWRDDISRALSAFQGDAVLGNASSAGGTLPVRARRGLFAPSCLMHNDFGTSVPLIKRQGYLAAFSDWYTGRRAVWELEPCGPTSVTCNPTCPRR
jgi:hypothetical protein